MANSNVFLLAEKTVQEQLMLHLRPSHDASIHLLSGSQEILNCGTAKANSSCLILGSSLGASKQALDVIDELRQRNLTLPCIFACETPTCEVAVAAYRAGVIEFIQLPMEAELIVPSVRRAFEQQRRSARKTDAERRFRSLTDSESRVISLMLEGYTNRRIASRMKMGVRTIERVRSRILKKIGVESPFEVARLYGLAFQDATSSPKDSVAA